MMKILVLAFVIVAGTSMPACHDSDDSGVITHPASPPLSYAPCKGDSDCGPALLAASPANNACLVSTTTCVSRMCYAVLKANAQCIVGEQAVCVRADGSVGSTSCVSATCGWSGCQ